MSIARRIARLEQIVCRDVPYSGVDSKTFQAILATLGEDKTVVDLLRLAACIEATSHTAEDGQLRLLSGASKSVIEIAARLDLETLLQTAAGRNEAAARLEAEADTRRHSFILDRFGADVADRFFAYIED